MFKFGSYIGNIKFNILSKEWVIHYNFVYGYTRTFTKVMWDKTVLIIMENFYKVELLFTYPARVLLILMHLYEMN
jgi:hypothetical protein